MRHTKKPATTASDVTYRRKKPGLGQPLEEPVYPIMNGSWPVSVFNSNRPKPIAPLIQSQSRKRKCPF